MRKRKVLVIVVLTIAIVLLSLCAGCTDYTERFPDVGEQLACKVTSWCGALDTKVITPVAVCGESIADEESALQDACKAARVSEGCATWGCSSACEHTRISCPEAP